MPILLTPEHVQQTIQELEQEYAQTERDGQGALDKINAEIERLTQQAQRISGETVGKMNNLRGKIDVYKSLLPVPNEPLPNGATADGSGGGGTDPLL